MVCPITQGDHNNDYFARNTKNSIGLHRQLGRRQNSNAEEHLEVVNSKRRRNVRDVLINHRPQRLIPTFTFNDPHESRPTSLYLQSKTSNT